MPRTPAEGCPIERWEVVLGRLALAAALALPCLATAWTIVLTISFLVDFLGSGRWQPLAALTPEPQIRAFPASRSGRPLPIDLHVPVAVRRAPALVLVHGLAPAGKDDPRLRDAAGLLARAGWSVAVPTVEGLTAFRLRPEDAEAVRVTVEGLRGEGYPCVALLGISLGAGPTLLAAADSPPADLCGVLALGGYASAVELLRYTLTGAYAFGEQAGRAPAVLESAIDQFARANHELMDDAGRRLVATRDPAHLDERVRALPPRTRALLDALSPGRAIERLRTPLFLVHGRQDPAVPFTESLRLEAAARAAGRPVHTAIVGSVGHVEASRGRDLADLARLWAIFYAFRRTAER